MDAAPCQLIALLQRMDSVIAPPPQQTAGPTPQTFPAPELPSRIIGQLTTEVRSLFCERLLQQFPGLATHPQTIVEACAHESMICAARTWITAELCDNVSTAASPMQPSSSCFPPAATSIAKTTQLRRRTLPREMAPSAISKEFALNTIDMVLTMLHHAGRSLPPTTLLGEESAHIHDDECSTSMASTAAQSPVVATHITRRATDDEDEVIFLDDFDAIMDRLDNDAEESCAAAPSPVCRPPPERVGSYCTPGGPASSSLSTSNAASSPSSAFPDAPSSSSSKRPKKSSSGKRRRDEASDATLEELITDIKRILKRQDQLLAGLSTMIFANVELSSTVPIQSVALCLSEPLLRWLNISLQALTTTTSIAGVYQRLHDTVTEAADEIKGCHDVDILFTSSNASSGMKMARSVSFINTDDASRTGAASAVAQSRSTSPLQHLVLMEDSQNSSCTMRGSTSGYTADGDKFSIPPPFQRTVSDVVRRVAPPALDKSRLSPTDSSRAGQVSPPRSPLFGMQSGSSFGKSPVTSNTTNLLAPKTAVRRPTGSGSRTPCTVPKRSSEIPSYMLMKRKPAIPNKPHAASVIGAAISHPPVVALSGSPDCSISLPPPAPPVLSLDFTTTGVAKQLDDSFLSHGREDRVLFMDDDED